MVPWIPVPRPFCWRPPGWPSGPSVGPANEEVYHVDPGASSGSTGARHPRELGIGEVRPS